MVARLARTRWIVASVSLPFVLGTCTEGGTGPARHLTALAVSTALPSSAELAAFNLVIDNVRLIVVRPPADTLFDQVFAFPANQTSLPLTATVDLAQDQETLEVTIQLLSGTQVLFSGTQSVQVTSGDLSPTPADIPVSYDGPGKNVTSLTLDPQDSVLSFGGVLAFRPTARDAQNNPVPDFYLSWTTSNPTVAKIDATGRLTAPSVRGTFTVRAYTWDSVTASTPITIAPVATAITIVSGCGQSALPGAQLPLPVIVKVIASDNLGVKGIMVQFTPPPGGSVTPAQVEPDAAGLASTLVRLGTPVGQASMSIGANGLTSVTCNQTVQTLATKLAFTAQPTGTILAGSPFTVVVTAQDALGNPATSYSGSITLDIGTNPGGATLTPRTVTATSGVAAFANVTIDKGGTGYTLVATSGTLTPATSTPFDVSGGSATQLAFTTQPVNIAAGASIGLVVVTAQDGAGGTASAFAGSVTLSLGQRPTGAILGGTVTVSAVAGVATFTNLGSLTLAGTYTLVASTASLPSGESAQFAVSPGSVSQLAFTAQPTGVPAGALLPAVVITGQDSRGNTATSFAGTVTLAFGSHPVGSTLSGTTDVVAVAGVATFADLSLDSAGGYTLVVSSLGLQSVASTSFTISAGAAAQLVFTTQPVTIGVGAIMPLLRVAIQDAIGNTVLTATNNITLALDANPGGAALNGTLTKAASSGVALFTGLTLDKTGIGYTLLATSGGLPPVTSAAFNITAGATAQLAVTITPTSVAGTPVTLTVTAKDGTGNTVSGYLGTVHFTSSDAQATLPADYSFIAGDNGTHTFTGGATLKTAGVQSVTATDVVTSSITGAASVGVSAGVEAALAFSVQPSTALAGASIAPPVVVAAHDAFGNVVTGFSGTVTLDFGANPGGAILTGGSADATAGLASFSSLSVDKSGTSYTLVATSGSLTPATSASFTITAAAATQLVVSVTPGVDIAGAPKLVVVAARDGIGNTATGYRGTIHFTSGDAQAVLPPDYTFTAGDNGVHAFPGGASLRTVGSQSVSATDIAIPAITGTQSVSVTPGTAVALFFTVQPSTTSIGAAITPPVQVTARDGFGNTATGFAAAVSLGFGNNPGSATLGGTTSVPATAGVATFSGLTLNQASTGYTLTAAATGLAGATSTAFDITLVGATLNAWTSPVAGFWSVPANWSLGRVPQTTDSVAISLTGTYTVTLDTTISIAFLTFGASSGVQTLAMSTRALTVTNAVTIQGGSIATVNNGTIAGPAALTNQGTLTLGSAVIATAYNNQGTLVATGTSQLTGAVTTTAGDSIIVRGNGTFGGAVLTVSGGSWSNLGAIVLTDVTSSYGATLTVPGGTLTNGPTGTIDAPLGTNGDRNLNAVLANQGSLTVGVAAARRLLITPPAGASISNSATMIVTSGSLQITQSGSSPNFTTSGTIQLTGGTFSLNQPSGATPGSLSVTATGQLLIGSGQTFTVTGGVFTLPAGATVAGAGTLALSGATANVTPDFNTGLTGLNLVSATWNGPGILTNPSGSTLNLQNSTVAAPFVNQGTLVATGTSRLTGSVSTAPGDSIIVLGNGTFGGGTLQVTGGTWTNNGAIVLTDVTSSYGATLAVTTGTLNNQAGSTIEAPVGTGGDRALNATLNNQGTVTVGVAAARKLGITPPAGASLSNSGTISINAGLLQITQSGTNPGFSNSGAIQLTGGSFSLSQPSGATPGTLTTNGSLAIGTGRTFTVTGGVLTVPSGATVTGAGTLALSGAIANVTPNFNTSLTGLSLLNSTWNGPGTLTNPGGSTLNLQNSTVAAPFVNQGTLVATGTSQLTGTVTTAAGDSIIVLGNGTFGGALLTVSGGSWVNNGAIVLTDVVSSYGAILTVPSGTLTNPVGSTIEAPLGTSGDRGLNAALINQGSLIVAPAAARKLQMTPPAGASLTNSATITINSGSLQITQSGANPTFTNSGATQLTGGNLSLTQPSGATPGVLTTSGTVTIGSGRTFTVTGGTFNINTGATITGAGTLALSGAIANVTPNFNTSVTGLSLLNSTWNGPGTLTNPTGTTLSLQNSTIAAPFVHQGTLISSGTSQLTGSFTTLAGDSVIVQGNGTFGGATLTVTGGSWTNNGAIVLTDVVSSYGATLTVPSGTLTNPVGSTIDAPLGTGGDRALNAAVNNAGTLKVGVSPARKLSMNPPAGASFSNSATIQVNAGLFQITQSGASPSFTNTATGSIQLVGGNFSFTQPSGATPGQFSTAGAISIGSGQTFTLTGGTFNLNTGATFTGSGTLTLSGATANVSPNFNTGALALSLVNSTWNGPGSLINANGGGPGLSLQSSTITTGFTNQGTLTASGSSVLSGLVTTTPTSIVVVQGNGTSGGANLQVMGTGGLTNNGTINLTDVVSSYGATLTLASGILTNAAGAKIQSLAGAAGPRTLALALSNDLNGTVSISRSTTLSLAAAGQVNSGLMQLIGGDLTVVLSGFRPGFANDVNGVIDVGTNKLVINNQSTGTFLNNAGGTVRGSGTVDIGTASFITNGTTIVGSSPGILNWVGTYTQGPTPSVFQVEIGGSGGAPGTAYDQFRVSDNVTLQGGTLNVTQIAPVSGQTYIIMQVPAGKTITGDFQNKSGLGLCASGVSGTVYVIAC